jgi:4-diphosphocytidyl-2-C-methyl-D-erythritol kinase
VVTERAFAKLNLILHVARPRADGMHPLASLFASIDLADEVAGGPARSRDDSVECEGVDDPWLALAAIVAFRESVDGALPPIAVRIHKRIPVAAGLGGGSADAAAVLRIANVIAGEPLDADALRAVAADLGSDVPSQVEPRHALVQGVGERVEPVDLPPLAVVLLPHPDGLSTRDVYAELDRRAGWRQHLDPGPLRRLAAAPPAELAARLENDLQVAALTLRPELARPLERLREAGALGAGVSGSGPTCFGLFEDRAAAERAAESLGEGLVSGFRAG